MHVWHSVLGFSQSHTIQNTRNENHFYTTKIDTSVKFQSTWVSVNQIFLTVIGNASGSGLPAVSCEKKTLGSLRHNLLKNLSKKNLLSYFDLIPGQ